MEQTIKTYINPPYHEWQPLCRRRMADDEVVETRVKEILNRVRCEGDDAIRSLSQEIDGVGLDALEVTQEEIAEATATIADSLRIAIGKAAHNIEVFHAAQRFEPLRVETVPGVMCEQRAVPIRRVGLYVPGGTAPLFSTVLMLAIPARVAGCSEIIMCTPTGPDGKVAPAVLYAATLCGVGRIFKVGGAQAIAAMAYGTVTIPSVDKIFGPGNRYVTKAKELLSRCVAIDMPAGPSEVLVLADETAIPSFVASDILSQAEHGIDSQAILVCSATEIADAVLSEVAIQLEALPRKDIALKALANSRIVVLSDAADRVNFVNMYAPEHLILSTRDAWGVASQITSAGSVFVGNYTPESVGDYASGTNHTLPTSGWAHSHSGVNLDSFVRKITYQSATPEGLSLLSETVVTMARAEGLDAHANAVIERLRSNEHR